MTTRLGWTLAPVLAVTLGCAASRPVVQPTAHARQVGEAQVEYDIEQCRALAKQAERGGAGSEMAKDAAISGTVGGAAGAAGGAIWGHAGQGAAAGAVGGVVASVMNRLLRPRPPSPVYVNTVNRCLAERGYEVAGWQ